jgi:glycosyltransferase involved in cell wall biosynthesis
MKLKRKAGQSGDAVFFSVIIPTYNSGKTIKSCLESIVFQAFDDFEVLIMDGLSTDDTKCIVESFSDTRIKFFSDKDSGIYDAMNKGIARANGKWLYFLGSDDRLHDNNVFKDVYNAANTSFSVIYGNVRLLGDTGWGKKGQIYNGRFSLSKMLISNVAHQSIFYNKEVFKLCGGYSLKYPICADQDINLRIASKFEFIYIDRVIADFAEGGTSTGAYDVIWSDDFVKNVAKYYRLKLFSSSFKPLENRILGQAVIDLKSAKILSGLYFMLVKLYLYFKKSND